MLAALLGACTASLPVLAPSGNPAPSRAAGAAPDDEAPLPYSAAVAARFPAPAVRYDTPAFRGPGFTSNEALGEALQQLARPGEAAPGTRVTLLELGRSQAGLPLQALHLRRAEPGAAPRPRVLLIGQQHGDEPAAGEALLVLARSLAAGSLNDLLDRIEVVVMPRANPDGAAVQQRVTLSGIDANRDHLLLRTPEAAALARLVREFDPAVVVDAHEHTAIGRYLQKFGAIQRNDMLLQYAMVANLHPALGEASERWFRQPILQAMTREGLRTEWYYTNPTTAGDMRLLMGGVQPDTGRNVNGLRNTVSLLLESRGVGLGKLHLARRVHSQVVAQTAVLRSAAAHAPELLALRQRVADETRAQACHGNTVVLAGQTPTRREMLFLEPKTGADKAVVVDWYSSLQLRKLRERARPCGYWLAPDATEAVERLRGLGVAVQRVEAPVELSTEAWRETSRSESARPDVRGTAGDAGSTIVNVQVALDVQSLSAPPGSWYVPLAQPLAALAIAALEPDTQNSYFANRVLSTLGQAARVMAAPPAAAVR